MHRKTTSRRENKRLDSKKVRAAEKAALDGGHIKTVRTDHWTARDDRQPPILDQPSNGKKHKKKKQIPYCSARPGKRHAYLHDEEVMTGHYWNDESYTYTHKYKICVYCGKNTSIDYRWHYRW